MLLVSSIILLPVAYLVFSYSTAFWRNWQAAKISGIPYIFAPAHHFDRLWITTEGIWLKLFRLLPTFMTDPWIDLIPANWPWDMGYAPFKKLKTDTFLIVTPLQNMLVTADPAVISQITGRRGGFFKPIDMYQALDIYGKNVVTTEGNNWRRHRKITAPPFGEHNNRVVWKESVFQAAGMLQSWLTLGDKIEAKSSTKSGSNMREIKQAAASLADNVSKDSMRLSLHVISRAGFDVRCLWPGTEGNSGSAEGAMKSGEVPAGRTMSYTDSIETLLHRVILLILFPDWFLALIPSKVVREARTAFKEWGLYMQDIFDRNASVIAHNVKEDKTQKQNDIEGLDLMGSMIEHSGMIEGTPNHGSSQAGLSRSEIMGNSFVLFLAGHETAANSIHFCIVFMALRPGLQRRLQAELDSIFGDRDPRKDEWDYDNDLPKLFAGLAGAIMNEELRLIPPVVNIPKCTQGSTPLTIDGKTCTVPGDAKIAVHAAAVHRNPKHWPNGAVRTRTNEKGETVPDPIHPVSNLDNDLEEFKPERWLLDGSTGSRHNVKASDLVDGDDVSSSNADADLAVNTAADTAATLFRPARGAYIPFSDGNRSCVGRRFAQVEILATLAVIFWRHSIELAVEESEDAVQAASEDDRKKMWLGARSTAEYKLTHEMATIFTLQLRGEGIKMRVCERGNEVFDYREF